MSNPNLTMKSIINSVYKIKSVFKISKYRQIKKLRRKLRKNVLNLKLLFQLKTLFLKFFNKPIKSSYLSCTSWNILFSAIFIVYHKYCWSNRGSFLSHNYFWFLSLCSVFQIVVFLWTLFICFWTTKSIKVSISLQNKYLRETF